MLAVRSELNINGVVAEVTDLGSVGTAAFLEPRRYAAREKRQVHATERTTVPQRKRW